MNTCLFCSAICSSSFTSVSNCRWSTTNPTINRPIQFALRKHPNRNSWRIARVFQKEGVGVLFPDESVSVRTPEIDTDEGIPVRSVAETVVEQGVLDLSKDSQRRYAKKREEDDGEDSYENRFQSRNGKEVFEEKAYLVGVECKGDTVDSVGIEESLNELAQLADTAGLMVIGSSYQKLATPNPRTYIRSGKVAEIKSAIDALGAEAVIFDDELSAGQLRNLEKAFGRDVRVCDRTALILDIFNQRAATHEASIQVALAQMEYQLPRLTKMWTHLERQTGGRVKGMGEKQIEVDKRILRNQIVVLKKELDSVRKHRKQYRNRRGSVPVVSLVGYTNAGKSTLLNLLTGSDVLVEDRLFATLDPTTRRVQMKNGKEFLVTDTVGFIQKLPTLLVAAFRATLEEISESSLLVHVVDISHPFAKQHIDAVDKVLAELDVTSIPKLMAWNKVDKATDPLKIKLEAEKREDTVAMSALSGDGLDKFLHAVQEKLKDSMVCVEALIPFDKGEFINRIHRVGLVETTEYREKGTLVKAYVPPWFARQITQSWEATCNIMWCSWERNRASTMHGHHVPSKSMAFPGQCTKSIQHLKMQQMLGFHIQNNLMKLTALKLPHCFNPYMLPPKEVRDRTIVLVVERSGHI